MLSTLRCNNDNRDLVKYLCPKCNKILRDAVQTSCGHWLCDSCAEEIFIHTSPKCPHHDCDELLTEEGGIKYFPDRFVRKEVNKLPVSCPNTHRGCDWTGVFGNLESHLRNCAFKQAACQHCNQLIPVHQILMHQASCSSKLDSCPFTEFGCQHKDKMTTMCVHDHLTDNLVDHLYIIADHLKRSINSKADSEGDATEKDSGIFSAESSLSLFSLPKMGMHVERDGSGGANGIAPYRGREVDLMPMLQERNVQLFTKGALNHKVEIDALKSQLHTKDSHITSLLQKVAQLEKQVQVSSSQSEDRDFRLSLIENINYDGTMIWKIPQFSQRMEDARSGKYTSIFSLPFYSGRYGYKMCLRLYILGDGIGKNTHMSLFFVVMKGEFDAILQWPFTHKVSFRLINQHHGRDIVDVFQPDPLSSSFQRPKTDMNVASGCPRFISLAELNQGGFIEDNTIFIKVKVDVSTIKHP